MFKLIKREIREVGIKSAQEFLTMNTLDDLIEIKLPADKKHFCGRCGKILGASA